MSPDTSRLPPSGTLTFLFTDIEGSTRKASELGDDWFDVLEAHHAVLRPVFAAHGGLEVSTAGDSFFLVFERAADAIAASVAMQHAITAHDWSPHVPIRVRMGMHTGPARFRAHDNDYAGLTVHAASRVESAAAGAQVLISQATLDAAAADFPDGVDVLDLGFHRLKDLPSETHIYQVVAPGLEREFPPVRGLDVVRNNVPAPASNFIGRTDVLTRLHHLLDEDRLVTITGPGGTGKTRVATQLATERLHRHVDGVWFVTLAGATNFDGVVAEVADALGVRESGERALVDTLVATMQHQNVLLVIDNCEHVIDDAATLVERVLAAGLGVRVVATSREPLELDGERLYPLAPLSIDDEAVALLVDRIALVDPEFAETEDDRRHVQTIAARLDGLPLALELAAASAAELTLEDIATQLDNRFALLTKGKRTAAERQKTLWGAIDWSYGLLGADEQRLFRRLAVFPAEFDFGVAHAVCGDAATDVEEGLPTLIRKSLVAESPSTRLRYLESVRAYAREQLVAAGEFEQLAERHARYFVDTITDETAPEWVDTVSEDLAAALRWGSDHDAKVELHALIQLQLFWLRKGRLREARATSDAVLARRDDEAIGTLWAAIGAAGRIALSQGDTAGARAFFQRTAAVAERFGSATDAQFALGDLSQIALREGDFDTAEQYLERSLEAARRTGEDHHIALCLTHLANVASQRGDYLRAWNLALDAQDRARSLQWDDLDYGLTSVLGMIARQRGELDEARRVLADALALAKKHGNEDSTGWVQFVLGSVELDAGNRGAARGHLRTALELSVEVGATTDLVETLEAVARLAAADDPDLAATLLATADTGRDEFDFVRPPSELAAYEALVQRVGTPGEALALDAAAAAALAYLADESNTAGSRQT